MIYQYKYFDSHTGIIGEMGRLSKYYKSNYSNDIVLIDKCAIRI